MLSENMSPIAESFCIRVADLVVRIRPIHRELIRFCSGYVVDDVEDADIEILVKQSDIDAERNVAVEGVSWTDAYLETLVVQRAIADVLPARRRLLMHGAVVEFNGLGYLFTAPSGTGKSTHVRLWRQYLGKGVHVVNGDKPFIYVPDETAVPPVAYGTPWCGKEGWQQNSSVPLAGIVLLSRSDPGMSTVRRVDAAPNLDKLLRQVYFPSDVLSSTLTLELLDSVLGRVPVYELACDMSEDAVRVSFEGLTGGVYEGLHKGERK